MSHFYASIEGNLGEGTRCGTKTSGMNGHVRGWNIGGYIFMRWNEKKQRDEVTIDVTCGSGGHGTPEDKRLGTFYLTKNGKSFRKVK